MGWQTCPYIFPLLLTAVLALLMAWMAWKQRGTRHTTFISSLMVGVALWSFGCAMVYTVTDMTAWHLWTLVAYLGILSVPTVWFVYALRLVGLDHLFRWPYWLLLLIEPVLAFTALLTDPIHHLFYARLDPFFTPGGWMDVTIHHGPLFFANAVYTYLLVVIGTALLARALLKKPRSYGGETRVALGGAILPWLANMIYIFDISPWPSLDLTPFGFLIAGLTMMWIQFSYQMTNVFPIARARVIEAMPDPMMVLDIDDHIIDFNPAFKALAGMPAAALMHMHLDDLVNSWPGLVLPEVEVGPKGESILHIPAANGQSERYYHMRISELQNQRGQLVGHVVLLHDETREKQISEENRRLFQAERNQRRIAETLHQTGQILAGTLDMDSLLDHLLVQLARLAPYDAANFMIVMGSQAVITRARGYEKFGLNVERDLRPLRFDLDTTPNLQWMAENRVPMIIPDTRKHPGWVPVKGIEHILCWMGAPLVARGRLIGFISLDKAEPDFYTPEHIERLAAFSGQAALAVENARLYQETADMLRRERQLNEVVHTISGTLDLDTMLPAIVRLACDLVGADRGVLALVDSQTWTLQSYYVHNYHLARLMDRMDEAIELARQVMTDDRPLLLSRGAHDGPLLSWLRPELTGLLCVPVSAGNERLGILALAISDPDRKFTPRDAELVEAVGRQAGIAIQNAQHLRSARKRADEAETLRAATAAVSSALEPDQVLDRILTHLEKVLPYDSACIFLQEGEYLTYRAGRGFSHPDRLINFSFRVNQDQLYQEAVQSGKAIVLADAQNDPRFQRRGDAQHVRGWIGLPLQTRGQTIGLLTIDSREVGAYSEADAALAQAFANEAATAIENARLFAEVQRLALVDSLTGLVNRRHFFELARREYERARRYGTTASMLMIDLDNLKEVNDQFGHLAGDRMIQMVAQLCRDTFRASDILGRYGGDELVVMMPETGVDSGHIAAERLRAAIANSTLIEGGQSVSVSISIGIAELTPAIGNLDQLVDCADQALYQAKGLGKNQIVVWQEPIPSY